MEIYTSKPLLNHHQTSNMNIVTHRQIHGINKHNRDTYIIVNPNSFIEIILIYKFPVFIPKQLQAINKNNREYLSWMVDFSYN